jgi:hypothetical protein
VDILFLRMVVVSGLIEAWVGGKVNVAAEGCRPRILKFVDVGICGNKNDGRWHRLLVDVWEPVVHRTRRNFLWRS